MRKWIKDVKTEETERMIELKMYCSDEKFEYKIGELSTW